jgi:hypothetical protein
MKSLLLLFLGVHVDAFLQLHIIDLVSSGKFQHFQAVLDLYIKESFSATLAYQ